MRPCRRYTLAPATLLLLLGACSAGRSPLEGVFLRSDDWPRVLDTGLAVSPVVAAHPVTGGAAAGWDLTREFFLALEGSTPGTPLLAPDELHRVLEAVGPAAHARLRAIRRAAYRDEAFDAGRMATFFGEIGYRYLVVGWMDEGTAEGLQSTVKDDLSAFEYQMHVHGYSTEVIHGLVTAMVIDLEQAEKVWHGAVEYESKWLDWDDPGAARAEIYRTRAAAAVELASRLAVSGPGSSRSALPFEDRGAGLDVFEQAVQVRHGESAVVEPQDPALFVEDEDPRVARLFVAGEVEDPGRVPVHGDHHVPHRLGDP